MRRRGFRGGRRSGIGSRGFEEERIRVLGLWVMIDEGEGGFGLSCICS